MKVKILKVDQVSNAAVIEFEWQGKQLKAIASNCDELSSRIAKAIQAEQDIAKLKAMEGQEIEI